MADNEESKHDHCNEPDEKEETFIPMQVDLGENFASKNPEVVKELSKHQLRYSMAGLIVGAESQLSDAAPGAVLFIVGVFVVLITKYAFNVKKNA